MNIQTKRRRRRMKRIRIRRQMKLSMASKSLGMGPSHQSLLQATVGIGKTNVMKSVFTPHYWGRIHYLRLCRELPDVRLFLKQIIELVPIADVPRLIRFELPSPLAKLVEAKLKGEIK